MKQLDQQKFKETVEKARVQFGLTYWGKSNNMHVVCKWNEKKVELDKMTDEQVTLLWQLVNASLGMLVKEQMKRDLLPEELAKMYREAGSAAQVKSKNPD